MKNKILYALSWFFSVLFILNAITMLFIAPKHNILVFIIFMIPAVVLNPIAKEWLAEQKDKKLSLVVQVVVAVVCYFTGVLLIAETASDSDTTSEKALEQNVENGDAVKAEAVKEPSQSSVVKEAEGYSVDLPTPVAKDYSNVVYPYTEKAFPKLYAAWGSAWVNDINEMLPRVAQKVDSNPNCDSPEIVEISTERSSPKKEAVFFVDCKNGERFYVSQNELDSSSSIKSESQMLSGKPSDYIQPCREAVISRLNYPSTFNEKLLSTSTRKTPNGNIEVIMPFTAKNALGAELPQTARCLITTQNKLEVTITNR